MEQLTNLFQVHKTVKFELRPIGRTAELINSDGFLASDDKDRAMAYQVVKCLIDDYYQNEVIAPLLEKIKDNKEWNRLLVAYGHATDSNTRKTISQQLAGVIDKSKPNKPSAKSLHTPLNDYLQNLNTNDLHRILKDLQYDDITIGGKSLKAAWNSRGLIEFVENAIDKFKNFTLYFETLGTNLEQVFQGKRNGIAHRIIYQNLYTFIRNKNALDDLKVLIPEFGREREFTATDFSYCLHQSGIDGYNTYIGRLIQRLKEHYDSHPESAKWYKRFKKLHKQILSPRIAPAWLPAAFTNDEMMVVAINSFRNEVAPCLSDLGMIINQIETYDGHVFIYRKSLHSIAAQMRGDFSALDDEFEIPRGEDKSNSLSLQWLKSDEVRKEYFDFLKKRFEEILGSIHNATINAGDFLKVESAKANDYRKNNQASLSIKRLVDAYKQLHHLLRPLTGTGDEVDRDEEFYGDFMPIMELLQPINKLFDSVKNWLTKSTFSNNSYPVYLGLATILDNWSNKTVYLKKDGKFYFMMLNGTNVFDLQIGKTYDTIMYRFYSQPANRIDANLTRQFVFSKKANVAKGREEPTMAKFVRDHWGDLHGDWTQIKSERYKSSDNKGDLAHAISYFQKCLKMHPDYKGFDFDFRPATEYEDYASFVESLKGKLFRIEERTVCWNELLQLVEDGKVLLFQLYNKDYANNSPSSSTRNLHTFYWETVFSQQNRVSYDFKLEEPKLYFREKADVVQRTGDIHSVPLRYQKPKMFLYIPILMNANAQKGKDVNQLVNEQIQAGAFSRIIGIDRGERNLLYYSVLDMNGNIIEQDSLNIISGIDYHAKLMEKEAALDDERRNWKARSGIRKLKEGYLSHVIHQLTNLILKHNAILVVEDLDDSFKRSRQKRDIQIYQLFEKMLIEKLSFLVDKNVKDEKQIGSSLHALQLTNPDLYLPKTGIKQNGILFFVPPEYTSAIDPITGFCNLFDRERVKDVRRLLTSFRRISYNAKKDWFEFEWDYQDVLQYTRLEQCTNSQPWVACTFDERIEWTGSKQYRNRKCENIALTAKFRALFEKYKIEYQSGNNIKEVLYSINKKDDIKELKHLFFLTLSLRNKPDQDTDYILSPVQEVNGAFFDSRKVDKNTVPKLPNNGDANGAYNIAKKGLLALSKLKDGLNEQISLEDWILYVRGMPHVSALT